MYKRQTKQITHTPAGESGLSFAPDNRTLAYASERNGNWQLYLAKIVRKEDPNFPNATIVEEEALLPSATVERAFPQFSPDGKAVSYTHLDVYKRQGYDIRVDLIFF